jgi:UDP-3-O-[3-hydroxymyristoyl] glucosamine N-acyltransferase
MNADESADCAVRCVACIAQDCAIGSLTGLYGQKSIKNNSDLGWGLM